MASKSPNKAPFWKRSSPKLPGGSMKSTSNLSPMPRHKLSFKEFEHHTEDAWDASEDDLLRDAVSKINIHQEHAMESAKAVIESHSKRKSLTPGNNQSNGHQKEDVNNQPPLSQAIRFPGGASRTVAMNDSQHSEEKKLSRNSNAESKSNSVEIPAIASPAPTKSVSKTSEKKRVNEASPPNTQSIRAPLQTIDKTRQNVRIEKFKNLVNSANTNLEELRELSWAGIPRCMRPNTWRILCDYMPANKERRETVLTRKRKEYFNFVRDYYDKERQGMHKQTFHQIHIDIPRTNPLIPLFQIEIVQEIFERLLFIWAIRHPASGYVQGINDLVTPFFIVFLSEQIETGADVETYDVSQLSEEILQQMEADTFWCTSKLLDGIQDNYTFAQPGVQTKVQRLQELNKSVDEELHNHLEHEQVEYLQFAFRWMNNLLMREIPLRCTIRLWDTYLAEANGFSDFHLYVCVAFLSQWRKQLLAEKDFQGLMIRLQNVPTSHWGDEEIGLLLAEAFRLRYTYKDAQSHLSSKR